MSMMSPYCEETDVRPDGPCVEDITAEMSVQEPHEGLENEAGALTPSPDLRH